LGGAGPSASLVFFFVFSTTTVVLVLVLVTVGVDWLALSVSDLVGDSTVRVKDCNVFSRLFSQRTENLYRGGFEGLAMFHHPVQDPV
jgi:hypothetical protein